MSSASDQPGAVAVPLRETYLVQLREHAIALIWLGYGRMDAPAFSAAEEDAITGELVRHVRAELERTEADTPLWFDHYSVGEQVRSDAGGKLGKSRPIVDVQFERVKRGFRPCLRFEAKRLSRGAGAGDYLGSEGLGAFLSGHYSRTHNEAGMLGYVQIANESHWARKLSAELKAHASRYRVTKTGHWQQITSGLGGSAVHKTEHTDRSGAVVVIFHLLLSFSPSARQPMLL